MKSNTKILIATIVGGLVTGALALAQGLPGDRVIVAAGIGAVVVLGLLIVLKSRP